MGVVLSVVLTLYAFLLSCSNRPAVMDEWFDRSGFCDFVPGGGGILVLCFMSCVVSLFFYFFL